MALFLIDIPDHLLAKISKRDTNEYIREAVVCWAGGGSPDHPFFGHALDRKMKVTTMTKLQEAQAREALNLRVKSNGHNPRLHP